jgi:uncharacterized protein
VRRHGYFDYPLNAKLGTCSKKFGHGSGDSVCRPSRIAVRLLIDGYNLLYVTHTPSKRDGAAWLANARLRLIETLRRELSATWQAETTIVFDAKDAPQHIPATQHHGNLVVLFARDHAEADDLLEELIERAVSPSKLMVVSGDRRIQRAAKRRKAQVCDSGSWYDRLLDGEFKKTASSAGEGRGKADSTALLPAESVRQWLAEFALPAPEQSLSVKAAETADSLPPKSTPANAANRNRLSPHKGRPISKKALTEAPLKAKSVRKSGGKAKAKGFRPIKGGRQRSSRRLLGDVQNPFPEGYGEDLVGEES